MLRVALPNKGQLSEPAKAMLSEAGYRGSRNPRDLVIVDEDNGVEFFLLRPRDIATYVGSGTLDLGITGKDMLADSSADAEEVLGLGFAPSTFRLAALPGVATEPGQLNGRRIATSYPQLLQKYLRTIDITADVVPLDGAVENAIRLGVADAVADVVDTGTTLRQAGLEILGEPILHSEAILIRRQDTALNSKAEVFIRRLEGVLTARAYVLVDYDIPLSKVDAAL